MICIRGKWFPEGPTHMLPLLMRALPGVDPNDFSKCMVKHICNSLFYVSFNCVSGCPVTFSSDIL